MTSRLQESSIALDNFSNIYFISTFRNKGIEQYLRKPFLKTAKKQQE
jgi:hypothetical protein